MRIDFVKVVNNVDMGTFGKKNLSVEIKLAPGKSGWELSCWYCYIIENNGNKSPVQGNIISHEFLKKVVDECLDEVKTIATWNFPR